MNSLASRSIIWWIDHLGPGGAQEDLAVLTESMSTYNFEIGIFNDMFDI